MGTYKSWIVLVCFLWAGVCFAGSSVLRDKIVQTAETKIGVRELTGNNDGQDVEIFLSTTGLKKGYAWCAAFLAWCHKQNSVKNPMSAYCPDWFRTNVVYQRNKPTIKDFASEQAQVFGLYFESKKRVAHVGMLIGETRFNYITIEGNTNDAGSREGDGVYKKIRSKKSIYIISDYCKN